MAAYRETDLLAAGWGFEPSVSLAEGVGRARSSGHSRNPWSLLRGTDGSNPSPSSGELSKFRRQRLETRGSADRTAQEVARRYLEPPLEAVFHTDAYGYRPGRSAIDAVRQARQRCWRYDWVLDIDVKAYFDSIDWERFSATVAGALSRAFHRRFGVAASEARAGAASIGYRQFA